MAIPFYYDATTKLWRLGQYIVPAGHMILRFDDEENITIKADMSHMYIGYGGISGKYSDFSDINDAPYESMSQLITSVKNFFLK